jgi:dihydroxy-acid dehydratase
MITMDVDGGVLELEVEEREIARRIEARPPPKRHYRRGYGALFMDNVLQANEGCDFGMLRHDSDAMASPGTTFRWGC